MTPRTMLDTDILSAIMRNHPVAVARARLYFIDHQRFSLSLVTRFEILRGLKAKQASRQLVAFESFCASCEVLPLNDAVIVRAANLYGELYQSGKLLPDADLLIAATALEHDLALATNNLSDFARIPDLRIDNWIA